MTTSRELDQPDWVQNVDVPAVIAGFLNEVVLDDIFIEPVQNDIDAGATRTIMTFYPDKLVIEGNGRPVSPNGWLRLSYVVGAGGCIPEKGGGTGCKNHGLRTLWLLGNVIRVYSDGKLMDLSAVDNKGYLNPRNFKKPAKSHNAPAQGTRIEVAYRTETVKPLRSSSQLPELTPVDHSGLKVNIERILSTLTQRILGVIHPKGPHQYELIIRHYALLENRFQFRLRRSHKENKTWIRDCEHVMADEVVHKRSEQAIHSIIPFSALPKAPRIPSCYKVPRGVRIEFSWPLTITNRLTPEPGKLRYPFSFSQREPNMGVTVSAPFDLDRVRQKETDGNAWNNALLKAAEEKLPIIIRIVMIEHGPKALELIRGENTSSEIIEQRLKKLIDTGVLPVESKNNHYQLAPRRGQKQLMVPKHIDTSGWSSKLASFIPDGYLALSRRTPSWAFDHIQKVAAEAHPRLHLFDELDLVDLLSPPSCSKWWKSRTKADWKGTLRDTERMKKLLDIVGAVQPNNYSEFSKQPLYLPTSSGKPVCIEQLLQIKTQPPKVPSLSTPDLLHPDLVDHRTLKQRPFKVAEFNLSEWIGTIDGAELTAHTKAQLFKWMQLNTALLKGSILDHLKQLPIWRKRTGGYIPFKALCEPSESEVKRAMKSALHYPHAALLKMDDVKVQGNGKLRLRTQPSQKELENWYLNETCEWVDGVSSKSVRLLEKKIACIARTPLLRPHIKSICANHRTLSASGTLCELSTLHTQKIAERLDLLLEDTISPLYPLEKLLPACSHASSDAILRTIIVHRDNTRLPLQLAEFFAAKPTDEAINRLAAVPIIQKEDDWFLASEVAFASNKGNLWGTWRVEVDPRNWSENARKALRKLGAVGPRINVPSSIQFFQWLTENPNKVIHNIRSIFHQWKNKQHGPSNWWRQYPEISCLLVRSKDSDQLLPYRKRNQAWLSDNPVLAAVIEESHEIALVTERLKGIAFSPYPQVKKDVKSLAYHAKVHGKPNITGRKKLLPRSLELMNLARSTQMKSELPHRMAKVGLNSITPRRDWNKHLSIINDVRQCSSITQLYKIGKKLITVKSPHVLSEGTLWLSGRNEDLEHKLFEALFVEIFNIPAPTELQVLGLKLTIFDKSQLYHHNLETCKTVSLPKEEDEADDEFISVDGVHAKWTHNPKGELPRSIPTRLCANTDTKDSAKPKSRQHPRKRLINATEEEHIAQLKKDHYAYHCQACLSTSEPIHLAPEGCYVAQWEMRRRVIQAHHMMSRGGNGKQIAGNIICLCIEHHNQFGCKVSPLAVRQSLNDAKTLTRTFHNDQDQTQIKGLLTNIDVDGEFWQLWWTEEHARYWCESWSLGMQDNDVD